MNNLQKSLLYRSEHRGMREADILIGGFAREYLPQLDARHLDDLSKLLDQPDQDLLNWCMDLSPIPSDYDNPVMKLLKDYAQRSA